MGFALTPKQREAQAVLRGPQRHTLIYGGGRSGKTFLFVRALVTRALIAPESRHAILRLRGNAARASVALDTLQKVMKLCYPNVVIVEHRQDGYWAFPNGSQIWIGGLDDKARVEKILGQEFVTIYLNECSQIEYTSVLIARTRVAQVVEFEFQNPDSGKKERRVLPQRMYYDLNPVGTKHWSYQTFVEKRDPDSGKPIRNPEQFVYLQINPIDNAQNLSQETLAEYEALPDRQRRRFFEGDYQNEVDGALWTSELIEKCRCDPADVPEMTKIVVAVDPSGARGDEDKRSNEIGIIVAGLGIDGRAYLLEDLTCALGPAQWGRIAVGAYHRHGADRIVGETNYGGAMVQYVIQSVDADVRYVEVTASRGKWVRAEPISGFYHNDRVRHVGRFAELEAQLENFTTAGYLGQRSPDRADAMVWAMSDLIVKGADEGSRVFRNWRAGEVAVPRGSRPYFGVNWGFAEEPTVLVRMWVLGKVLYVDQEAWAIGCSLDATPSLFDKAHDDLAHPRSYQAIANPAMPETITFMQRHGYPLIEPGRAGAVLEEGVAFMQNLEIVVHPRCRRVIEALTVYAYTRDQNTGAMRTELDKNWVIDAMRFGIEKLYGGMMQISDEILNWARSRS